MPATAVRIAGEVPLDAIAQSGADDVEAYLALAPEGRRAVLNKMRDACRTLLAGFDESMRYGMPAYSRDGEPGSCLLTSPGHPRPDQSSTRAQASTSSR